jgi:hypothetical protein
MGWDRRGYFYRSQRCGAKVKRVYMGKGEAAQQAAAQATAARARRAAERAELADLQAQIAVADQIDAEAVRGVGLLLEATLLGQGMHLHRGEWRKHRSDQPTD